MNFVQYTRSMCNFNAISHCERSECVNSVVLNYFMYLFNDFSCIFFMFVVRINCFEYMKI